MTKKRLKDLLVILVVISLVGIIIFLMPARTTNEQRVFTSEEISNLQGISVEGNFNINITDSDSKDIKCSFSKTKRGYVVKAYELESEIKNNVLYVKTSSKNESSSRSKSGFVFGGESLSVNINIPKSYKNKLSIKSELNKINILNSNSEDIVCSTTDEGIKISLDKICGNITVNTDFGDIDFKLPKDEKFNLSASSRSGEVINNLDSNVDSSIKDKNINISASDGDITISGK